MHVIGDCSNFVECVNGPLLGALRDADDLGLGAMNESESMRLLIDQLWREFAVGGGNRPHLEAGHDFGCATLVDMNVRRLGTDHGFPAFAHRLQRDDVGTGAVENGVDLGVCTKLLTERLAQSLGDLVVAVGGRVALVDIGNRLKDLRMDAGVVIARKAAVHEGIIPVCRRRREVNMSAAMIRRASMPRIAVTASKPITTSRRMHAPPIISSAIDCRNRANLSWRRADASGMDEVFSVDG